VKAPLIIPALRAVDLDLSDAASSAYYLLVLRDGQRQRLPIMVQH
jgi:hypothetical protein